jgi:peroxiredoxin
MKKMNARTAKVGTRAPAFQMPVVDGEGVEQDKVELDDFLDQWLILLFYPRDFSLI